MHTTTRIALASLALAAHAAASAAPLQITTGGDRNSFGASLSHDGSRLAFSSASNLTGQNADRNFEIFLYERSSATLSQITNDSRGFVAGSQLPSISSDGSRIVFQSFETRGQTGFFRSLFHDVASNTTTALNDYSAAFQLTAITGNGQRIALNVDNSGLRILDTATGNFGPQLAFNPASFSMSGDGNRLALQAFNGGIRFIDVLAGTTTTILAGGNGFNTNPVFSADGQRIAFSATFDPLGTNADRNQELFVYDLQTAAFRQITNSTGGISGEASLSADGSRLAFVSSADLLGGNADGNQEIFVFDLLTDELLQITSTTSGAFSADPTISGDGLTLAFTSSGDLAGGNPNRVPQIYLQSLAPRVNGVPEPGGLALAVAALGLLWGTRRRAMR